MDPFSTVDSDIVSSTETPHSDAQCKAYTRFIMHAVVAGSICLLGFIGNSVSFLVLTRDKGTPVASFMLQALACTDNFFLCLWFLHFSLSEFFSYFEVNVKSGWLFIRLYSYPLLFVGQTATIWMTVLIAVSRYIAVCKPYKAAQMCSVPVVKKGVIGVLMFAIIYNLPRYFETRIIYKNITSGVNSTSALTFERTNFGDSDAYKLLYFDISYYITCFALPLVLLAALNTKLTISYRLVLQRKRLFCLRVMHNDTCDHNITLVLILVILAFMICNTPARIVQIVWRYKPQECLSSAFMLSEISNILEVLNSSINFLIYCVFRRQFRKILTQSVCSVGIMNGSAAEPRYADVQTQVNGHTDDGFITSMLELTDVKEKVRGETREQEYIV